VPEPKGRRGKLVENGWVALFVVAVVVAFRVQIQLVEVDGVPTEYPGQELVPRDVLLNCGGDAPALLVQRLVRPLRVQPAQLLHHFVVKTHENGVDSSEDRLLAVAGVTGLEAEACEQEKDLISDSLSTLKRYRLTQSTLYVSVSVSSSIDHGQHTVNTSDYFGPFSKTIIYSAGYNTIVYIK
jgi:hypothetical protein